MEVIPDEEKVAIDAVPLVTKAPTIVEWKIHKKGKNNYFQIIRADGSSKILVEDMDLLLWGDLKTMFEPHVEDEIWKLQQRYAEQEALDSSCLTSSSSVSLFSKTTTSSSSSKDLGDPLLFFDLGYDSIGVLLNILSVVMEVLGRLLGDVVVRSWWC
ncbi:hypothetical protein Tco_0797402 [Tanacetum coccineum]